MSTYKKNYNNSFKIEKYIQDQTKQILQNLPSSIQQISNIMVGRAGTHRCFRQNFETQHSEGIKNHLIFSKKSKSEILRCKRSCKFLTKIKSVIFTLIVLINSCAFFNLKNNFVPNVFVFSLPKKDLSNSEIYNFFFDRRIKKHLQNIKIQILVQRSFRLLNQNQSNIISTRYIPLYLLRHHLSFRSKIQMQRSVVKNLIKFLRIDTYDPLNLCYRELLFETTLYKSINFNQKIDVIYTQSNLRTLSAVSYIKNNSVKLKNIMAWYSTNSELIYKKGEKAFKIENNYLSLDRIDCHLVWDEYAKTILARITSKNIYICGSLLFYPREKIVAKRIKTFNVLIFDITPKIIATNDDFLNTNQATNTLQEIVNVVDNLRFQSSKQINLCIKSKRMNSKFDSQYYLNYLKELQHQKKIQLLGHSQNLYQLISGSDLVISVPWSSPAVIAKELGVESIYYVSDRKCEWKLKQARDIKLIRNDKDLNDFIRKCMVSKTNYV